VFHSCSVETEKLYRITFKLHQIPDSQDVSYSKMTDCRQYDQGSVPGRGRIYLLPFPYHLWGTFTLNGEPAAWIYTSTPHLYRHRNTFTNLSFHVHAEKRMLKITHCSVMLSVSACMYQSAPKLPD